LAGFMFGVTATPVATIQANFSDTGPGVVRAARRPGSLRRLVVAKDTAGHKTIEKC